MSSSLRFSVSGNQYKVSLTPAGHDAIDSVLIGGIKYSIEGQKDAIDLFKQKTKDLKPSSVEELQHHLSHLDGARVAPIVAKVEGVGVATLDTKPMVDREAQNKSKVLSELRPSWPIPGSPSSASITDRMKALGVPGVTISVINGGKQEWSQGFGELSKPRDLVAAASISKTIASLTLMALIQEKAKTAKEAPVTLDTNVKDILDEETWQSITHGETESITIRQLMSHTAGIARGGEEGFGGYHRFEVIKGEITLLASVKDKSPAQIDRLKELQSIVEAARKDGSIDRPLPSLDQILKGEGTNSPPVRLDAKPGSQITYTGGGTMMIQKIIEVLAKTNKLPQTTFQEIVQDKIFKKLGMRDSTFSPKEELTVQGYGDDGKPLPGRWLIQPEHAAAGMWSTAEDLTRVAIGIQSSLSHRTDGIVDPRLATEMMKPPTGIELPPGVFPGLGVFVIKTSEATYFYHTGGNKGFRCLMIANDKGQGAVIMTNSDVGDELTPEIVRKIAEVYDWKGKDSLTIFPPLHPEVVETSRNALAVDPKKWGNAHKGQYESDGEKGAIVSVEIIEDKIYFRKASPELPLVEIIPVSEHVGIIKDSGRWFPIEFSVEKDKPTILNISGMKHTKLS